ncbi:MAG: lysoplasmalogenase [Ekhidna sp.]|nr:lysoplasmalogenase [Ekhidna sp.]
MALGIASFTPRTISWLYAAVSMANATAQLIPSEHLDRFTKPLLMPLLLFYVYQKSIGSTTLKILFLSGAILFSWFGDLALMYHGNEIYFILGIASFIIAQILYIIILRKAVYQRLTFTAQKFLPLIMCAVVFLYVLLPIEVFAVPVIVYWLATLVTTVTAYFRKDITSMESYKTALRGSVLFLLSVSILVINTCNQPVAYGGFFMALAYCAAQFFLTGGILKHVD